MRRAGKHILDIEHARFLPQPGERASDPAGADDVERFHRTAL
jgi:hypothetical protein